MIRSALYAPGNVPKMLFKVGTFGADAIVMDLEDTVPVAEKEAARHMVHEALGQIKGPQRYVRLNGITTGLLEGDLSIVFCPDLEGVYVPKVESAEELKHVDSLISELERRFGLEKERVEIHPIFETAKGVMQAYKILEESPARVRKAGFGAVDLMREIGVQFGPKLWAPDSLELLYARSHLVLAARAAGRLPPIDSVYTDIRDLDGLKREALLARRLGFQGKSAIHPNQVAIINRVFSPSPEEIDYARKVVRAFEEAEAKGFASFTVGNAFVDIPIVEKARSILDKFGNLNE